MWEWHLRKDLPNRRLEDIGEQNIAKGAAGVCTQDGEYPLRLHHIKGSCAGEESKQERSLEEEDWGWILSPCWSLWIISFSLRWEAADGFQEGK